jgi:tRNA(fMet)-specific endonuclease VapC
MILLDTDHLTILKYRDSDRYTRLNNRLMAAAPDPVGTTIVNVEEQMRGWLASIAKERTVARQVSPYRELAQLFEFFAALEIAEFSAAAADRFNEFRSAGVKIGTMDLKTAAIAIVNDALLLTANRRDFEQVPGLRFENWID